MKKTLSLLLTSSAVSAETRHRLDLDLFDFIKSENAVQSLI